MKKIYKKSKDGTWKPLEKEKKETRASLINAGMAIQYLMTAHKITKKQAKLLLGIK